MCDNIITWFAFNFGTIIKGFYTFSRCFYFDFYVKHLTKFDNSLSNKKLWKLNSPKASYSPRDICWSYEHLSKRYNSINFQLFNVKLT